MAYKIVITDSATKELKRIPAKMQDRIFEKIENLAKEPKPHGHKKLKNFDIPGSEQDDYYRNSSRRLSCYLYSGKRAGNYLYHEDSTS